MKGGLRNKFFNTESVPRFLSFQIYQLEAVMRQGTISWFDGHKGFATENESGKDIFIHESELVNALSVTEGDKITFRITEGIKGPKAVDIMKIM